MLNLNKFTQRHTFVAPVRQGGCQYNRKHYECEGEGWKSITAEGNHVIEVVDAFVETTNFKNTIRGFTFHNSIIFQNFDVAKRKYEKDLMAPLLFNNVPTFSPINAVVWEDHNLYFHRFDYSNSIIYSVASRLNQDGVGVLDDIKGVTPELKTTFLFHSIEIQNQKRLIAEAARKEKEREFINTVPGRLMLSLKQVGGELLGYSLEGQRIIIDWKMGGSDHKLNSIIDANTFRVIELGFCASGADRDHSITSMVLLADDYNKRRRLNITRGDYYERGIHEEYEDEDEWDD